MKIAPSTCVACGEPLDDKTQCLACLLRGGFDDSPESSEAADDSLVFDDFKISRHDDGSARELGRGAMGVTYRARDEVLHRDVALKVVKLPEDAPRADAARARFLREARAAAALRHPNVAEFFQFGTSLAGDRFFYAMELVEGETLEDLVRRDGPLPVATALELAIQVARALVAAAAHGLIHRDLKPANIMLAANSSGTPEPEVKVIDFGLAKSIAAGHDERDLSHGGFVGTPAFASPEQFAGLAADARSNLYSLGVTLWYALTGEVPYAGKTIDELRAAQTGRPLPIEELAARKVPTPVGALLRRLLAREPNDRPQSARDLLVALECRRLSVLRADRRPIRARATAIGCVLLLLAGFSLTLSRSPRRSSPRAKSIAVLTFENLSQNESNRFFADGIQDDLLTSLAQIHQLKVISRTSVMAYPQDGHRNIRAIGQALGVENILEGSVRREGNRVLLNVQLIDARHDRHIWAHRYDRTAADSIGLQGELANQIAAALKTKLEPAEKALVEARPTNNAAAYALYLRACGHEAAMNETITDLTAAAELYRQALALDPKFALARARLAIAEGGLGYALRNGDFQSRGRAEAEEALRLSPALGPAHMALGESLYLAGEDYPRALKELSFAATTSPNEPNLFFFIGAIHREQGQWREAMDATTRALERDPRNQQLLARDSDNHLFIRDWNGAATCSRRALLLAPDSADATITLAYIDVFRDADPAAGLNLVDHLPGDVDPDGIATETRWDLAMLERDYPAAERILSTSPVENFPRTGEGAKDFFEGRTARAMGDALSAEHHFALALPHFENRAREHPLDSRLHAELGQLYAYMGRAEDALREGRRAVDLEPESRQALHGTFRSANLALIYALLDKRDEALPLIKRLLSTPGALDWPDAPFSITRSELRLRWEWDSLRADPRFQKILARPEQPTYLEKARSLASQ